MGLITQGAWTPKKNPVMHCLGSQDGLLFFNHAACLQRHGVIAHWVQVHLNWMWEISQGALTLKILTHASLRVTSLSITIGILAPYGVNWRQQFHTNQIKPNQVTSNRIGKEKHLSSTECRTNKSGAKPSIECEASILTTAPALLPISNIQY